MKEIWKNVTGYENCYQVSNFGNVRSLDRLDSAGRKRKGRILIPIVDNLGYCSVHLLKNGKTKTIRIHRLVALEFLENPLNYKEINHKDENKQNNSAKNLEWCDRKYNMNYGRMTHNFHSKRTSGENNGRSILTKKDVEKIRNKYIKGSRTYGLSALSKEFGVCVSQIGNIVRRESWKG